MTLSLLLLLILAPAASAELNVSNFWGNPSTASSSVGGEFFKSELLRGPQGVAVRDATGDVYVADTGNHRIQQFTSAGAFIRAWGRDVIIAGKPNDNGTRYEICDTTALTPNAPADCKAGATTPAHGGTFNQPWGVAVNQVTGHVYVTDGLNLRVQEFTASGEFVRAWGSGVAGGGATGTATVTNGSATITAVVTTSKAFTIGQELTGTGIAPGTLITGVAAGQITMSQAATPAATGAGTAISVAPDPGNAPRNEVQSVTLGANTTGGTFTLTYTTPTPSNTTATTVAIPWNASAATVQTALTNLSNIGAGNVSVTSPNPGSGIGGPYLVEFKGARFADTNVNNLTATNTGLTVNVGTKSVAVAQRTEGGNTPEVCSVAASCTAGSESGEGGGFRSTFTGLPAVAPAGAPNGGNVLVPDPGNLRVQEFTASGAFVRAFGFDVVETGPGKQPIANEVQKITVAASGGTFTLGFQGQNTPPLPYDAPASEVEAALNSLITIGGVGASVSVTGGPGSPTGANPYLVTFGGTRSGSNVAQISIGTTGLGLAAGAQLSCAAGPQSAETLKYRWLRNGSPIGGADENTYFVSAADAGQTIQCQATATNANAGSTQVSNPAFIAAPVPATYPPGPPATIAAPLQSGALEGKVSRELTCEAGAWSGAPASYTYEWYRNGVAFGPVTGPTAATSAKVTLSAAEQTPAAVFQCRVTASNAGGSVSIVSANRATTPAPSSPAAPVATASASNKSVSVATLTEGSSGFTVCDKAAGDVCQAGIRGQGSGQFEPKLSAVAVDSTGAIYTLENPLGPTLEEAWIHRVQKFTPQGGAPSLSPAVFAPELAPAGPTQRGVRFEGPVGLAVDPATDAVLIALGENDRTQTGTEFIEEPERPILEYSSDGDLLNIFLDGAGVQQLNALTASTFGGGHIYFTSAGGNIARVYDITDFAPPQVSLNDATDVETNDAVLSGTVRPANVSLNTLYRFEYSPNGENWTSIPSVESNLGNGSGGVQDPTNCPVGNPTECELSQHITGLRANAKYFYRLRARTEFGKPVIVEGEPFVTNQAKPEVSTGNARWSSPPETEPSLLLLGKVNPSNARTTYLFQYVSQEQFDASGYEQASVAPTPPTPPIEAGHGYAFVDAKQVVVGADPSKTYHYRLVATNPLGTTFGSDRVVGPPQAGERYLEWVSAGDSYNLGVFLSQGLTGDGDRAYFLAEAFGNPTSLPSLYGPAITERGEDGWVQRDVSPAPYLAKGELFSGFFPSSDLSKIIWDRVPDREYQQRWRGFTLTRIDGAPDPNPLLVEPYDQPLPVPGGANMGYFGASMDVSSAVFGEPELKASPEVNQFSAVRVFANEPKQYENGRTGLVEAVDVGTQGRFFRLVNQTSTGQQLGGTCGANFGGMDNSTSLRPSKNAISTDGSVIYFKTYPVAPTGAELDEKCSSGIGSKFKKRVFKRIDGTDTVMVSESQCSRVKAAGPPAVPACQETAGGSAVPDADDQFEGASLDGSEVFISTTRQLTDSDVDATSDLYLYDIDPPAGQPEMVQVTAGEEVPVDHPTVGSGGKFVGAIGVANDGSRVYFVSEGRLTSAATAGARNLYVFERDDAHPAGRLSYVTQMGLFEGTSLAQHTSRVMPMFGVSEEVGGDGHILVFSSSRSLLAEDTDAHSDIYRYDDSGQELNCITCAGNEPQNTGMEEINAANFSGASVSRSRVVSEDGSVIVFATGESLLPEDDDTADTTCDIRPSPGCDVYVWSDGDLELVSGAAEAEGAVSPFVSADGKTVTFMTDAQLVLRDQNSARDIYAARIDGGFPEPATGVSCQSGEECHETPGPTPPPASPGTAGFSGPGNPPVRTASRKKCPKAKVRRHGKCVKKRRHKKRHRSHHGAQRASAGRGGAK